MLISNLIKQLKEIEKNDKGAIIRVASDEEWNTVFNKFEINLNSDNHEYILFGLSGTEQDM